MVRLVVLVFFISFLNACSSMTSRVQHDASAQPSDQVVTPELDVELERDEILRLDEGKHHPAVQVLLTQAEDARQQGQSQQALSYLDRARQIQPRNSAIFYRQAWLNYQLGELQQAQQLLQRARLFLRGSIASHDILQRRIQALQNKVDARQVF